MPKRTSSSSSSAAGADSKRKRTTSTSSSSAAAAAAAPTTNKKENPTKAAKEEIVRLRERLNELEQVVAKAKPMSQKQKKKWKEVWAASLRYTWDKDDIDVNLPPILDRILSHATRQPKVHIIDKYTKHGEGYNLYILSCELCEDDGLCYRVLACYVGEGWHGTDLCAGPPRLIRDPENDGWGIGFTKSMVKEYELPDAQHPAPPISDKEFEKLRPGNVEDMENILKLPAWKLLLMFMDWKDSKGLLELV